MFRNKSKDELSCLHLNIRSLVSNFNAFQNFIDSFDVKPDIIALSETKLTETVNLNPDVDLSGYSFIYKKSKTHFGGVGLYISDQIDYKIREDLDLSEKNCDCQTLFIEVDSNNKEKQVLVVFYRHPRNDFRRFHKEFEILLRKLSDKKTNFEFFGDYNIDYLKISKSKTVEEYTDMVFSNGALMPINKPTRVPIHTERCCVGRANVNNKKKCTLGKESLIDHFYTNSTDRIKRIGINVSDISDHYPIFAVMKGNIKR